MVSLSAFGGNFVLAKVRLGLISVRCSELRGVHFSEVRNVFYGKINRGQVICPLYRGCPLFGGSVIRGFTVVLYLVLVSPCGHLSIKFTGCQSQDPDYRVLKHSGKISMLKQCHSIRSLKISLYLP